LLSVLGGVVALGPIGILIGPMIVVFLQTLLNILQRELRTMDTSATPAAAGTGDNSLPLPIEGAGPTSAQPQSRQNQKPKQGGKK
jgi:hypothetical protein